MNCPMRHLYTYIPVVGLLLLLSLSGCKSRNTKTAGVRIENSPVVETSISEPADSVVFVEYSPVRSWRTWNRRKRTVCKRMTYECFNL